MQRARRNGVRRVIKTLSVKVRRPDLSREAFRSHYEGRHVPLGLGFVDRFGWRKYARNHLVAALAGEPGFDCLTEFWFGGPRDRERTRAFASAPEFQVLDEDDRRFLDTGRRLSFEVEEELLAGAPRGVDAPGTRRVAWLLERPTGAGAAAFARDARAWGRALADASGSAWERVALDLRISPEPGALALAAIVSAWPRAGREGPLPMPESGAPGALAVGLFDVVETPPESLVARGGTR